MNKKHSLSGAEYWATIRKGQLAGAKIVCLSCMTHTSTVNAKKKPTFSYDALIFALI